MPEPGTKPPSPARTVGQVATAAGGVALLLLWLILEPPPAAYRAAIAIVAIGGIIAGGVVILVALVRHVEYRFTLRYDEAAAAQHEHRQFVERHLAALIDSQQRLGLEIAAITRSIAAIDERTLNNCEHIRATETQVDRCMAELGIVAESIDELRERFVEEGLPQDLGPQHRHARPYNKSGAAVNSAAPLHFQTTTTLSGFGLPSFVHARYSVTDSTSKSTTRRRSPSVIASHTRGSRSARGSKSSSGASGIRASSS